MTDNLEGVTAVTESETVIDVEAEVVIETPEPEGRPFKVVTHKPGQLATFGRFGAEQDIGISVNPETAAQTLWWVSQDWAVQVLKAGIELPQLTAPPPGWLAALGEEWLHRQVGTLRRRDIPNFYLKHPDYLQDHPQVVVSVPGENTELIPARVCTAEALAAGQTEGFDQLPPDTLLQLDEMMPCVVEVRVWVAEGEVTASCPYRIGMVGWDSSLFLEMMLNPEGQKLTEQVIEAAQKLVAAVPGPPGYALDMGVTIEGTVTVLRVWPAWAAEPLSAEPIGVYRALVASHDFDGTEYEWRWSPDLAVYDRSDPTAPGSEDPEVPEDDPDPTPPVTTESESENPDES